MSLPFEIRQGDALEHLQAARKWWQSVARGTSQKEFVELLADFRRAAFEEGLKRAAEEASP